MVSFHENPVRRRVLVGLLFSVLRRPGDWDWWDEGVLGPRSQWLRRWSGHGVSSSAHPSHSQPGHVRRGLGSAHSLTERCGVLTAGAGLTTLHGNIFPVSDSMWAPLLCYCKGIITPLLRRSPGRRGWGPSAAAQKRGRVVMECWPHSWPWLCLVSARGKPGSILCWMAQCVFLTALIPRCSEWRCSAAPPNACASVVGMLSAEPRTFPAVANHLAPLDPFSSSSWTVTWVWMIRFDP